MTRGGRWVAVVVTVAVVAGVLVPAAATGTPADRTALDDAAPTDRTAAGDTAPTDRTAAGNAAAASPPDAFALQQVDADAVVLSVGLREDGSAAWTTTYRVRLTDDNETAAFESLRDDVEANPGDYTDRFAGRMRATARAAENATGREMAIRNVSVSASVESAPTTTYGVLTYRFEWTNFAAVEGDEIRAGDALAGLFLDDRTRMEVTWPAGYELRQVDPEGPAETSDGSVAWNGPIDFDGDQPRVVVAQPGPLSGLFAPAVGALLLLGAGGLAWRFRDRLPAGGGAETGGAPADGPPDAGAAADSGGAADAEGAASGEPGTADESADGPPEELLSNEERVLKVVRERGGRVKQQEIVEATGWTEAKTSQVVRDLREEERLEGFRLGRENVLRLPEADDSPAPDDGE